jgi:hypothetical protein
VLPPPDNFIPLSKDPAIMEGFNMSLPRKTAPPKILKAKRIMVVSDDGSDSDEPLSKKLRITNGTSERSHPSTSGINGRQPSKTNLSSTLTSSSISASQSTKANPKPYTPAPPGPPSAETAKQISRFQGLKFKKNASTSSVSTIPANTAGTDVVTAPMQSALKPPTTPWPPPILIPKVPKPPPAPAPGLLEIQDLLKEMGKCVDVVS